MRKSVRNLLVVAAMLACCSVLSGCLSHWFVDSSTRLQVENRTEYTIYGIDIVSEDGTEFRPWLLDTIPPGTRSRVYEEDWVGTFRVRVNWTHEDTSFVELDFEGGSQYLVISIDDDGQALFEFK